MEKSSAEYFEFTSRNFNLDTFSAEFNYEIGFNNGEKMNFTEKIIFPNKSNNNVPNELIENLLDNLHIILGISAYKLYCPPELRPPKLTKEQADFWNTVYFKGLGEFSYKNNIDLRGKIKFPFSASKKASAVEVATSERALLGIGGGKESVVALELLKNENYDCVGFTAEASHSNIAKKICEIGKINHLSITRIIDPKILKPPQDAFQGHIPVSAIYAFLGLFSAVLYDYRFVVVGNERSSNFGNIEYFGEMVNHQWSKSEEFENLFSKYVRKNITPSIRYFSILRPFFELRIAKMFAKYKKYFSEFISCNRAFRINAENRPSKKWCGECAKCCFTFLILAPYIPKTKLEKIFGGNLLNKVSLKGVFRDILGLGTLKPFDCVGTFGEARSAFLLVKEKYKDSIIIQSFINEIEDAESIITDSLKTEIAENIPHRFRLSGMETALVLGVGKEGSATIDFIKREYPHICINKSDVKDGGNYLAKQDESDIVIKTSGISKQFVYRPYTTATNIFFSRSKGKIIGVTGSKGKSTTASLIYKILIDAKKNVRFAGNIGIPMLNLLLDETINENTWIVLELSSYQLDDLEYSPHVAIVTALFPEHLDYHGTLDHYYSAKKRIIDFQGKKDFFVFYKKNEICKKWAKNCVAQIVPVVDSLNDLKTVLLGAHNLKNISIAATVTKNLGISEASIRKSISEFEGLPHRLEFVGEYKGIKFYDDAISTTPESTIAALRSVNKVGTIFLGGYDRGYDFSELEKEIKKMKIKNIVLFPESGKRMFFDSKGLNIFRTDKMKEAVSFAYENTPKGSACLLSCASPSYGLWKNFEEKGDQFKKLVKKMSV